MLRCLFWIHIVERIQIYTFLKSYFIAQMLLKINKLNCLKSTSFLEFMSYLLDILLR